MTRKPKVKPRTAEQKAAAIAAAQHIARSIMASHRAKAKAEAKPAKRKNQSPWRDTLRVHPAAEMFPQEPQDVLKQWGADIKQHGLRHQIVLWAADPKAEESVLDGRNRLDAMELVGLDPLSCPMTILYGSDGVDPYSYVISANIHRRHLTAEERRDRLVALIARTPEKSDRQLGKEIGVDHKTISRARTKGEDVGRIPHVAKRTDTKGRQQPANKKPRVVELRIANERRPPTPLPPQELHCTDARAAGATVAGAS
jgi:hypothetical protein